MVILTGREPPPPFFFDSPGLFESDLGMPIIVKFDQALLMCKLDKIISTVSLNLS